MNFIRRYDIPGERNDDGSVNPDFFDLNDFIDTKIDINAVKVGMKVVANADSKSEGKETSSYMTIIQNTSIKESKSYSKPSERIDNTEKSYLKSSTTRTETSKHVLEKKSSKVDTKEIIKVYKELKDLKCKASDKKVESDSPDQEKDSDDTPKQSSRRAAAKSKESTKVLVREIATSRRIYLNTSFIV